MGHSLNDLVSGKGQEDAEGQNLPQAQSYRISLKDLKEKVTDAMQTEISDDFFILLDQRSDIEVTALSFPVFQVERISFNRQRNRFSAFVIFEDQRVTPVRITGRITQLISVPVLIRSIPNGELIKEKDIEWTKVPLEQVHRRVITAEEQLIGHKPVRGTLRSGVPVYRNDVHLPMLVKKGSIVTLGLDSPRMKIHTKAQALSDGVLGDEIKVKNIDSNRVVVAKIIRENEVVIQLDSQ